MSIKRQPEQPEFEFENEYEQTLPIGQVLHEIDEQIEEEDEEL